MHTDLPGRTVPGPALRPAAEIGPVWHQTVRAVRRALAPFAVAGPLLCAVLLLAVEVSDGKDLTRRQLAGQAAAVLTAVAVNLLASRRTGMQLARTQTDLAAQVAARRAAEADLGQAVEDLTARQAFLSALVDTIDVEVVAVDAAGRSVVWNRASRLAYGVDDVDRPQAWSDGFGLFAADGETPLRTEQLPLLRALAGEHVDGEEIVVRPDRRNARRLLVHARPIRLPDGTPAGALTAAHDITVLRAQQDQLTRRNHDLDAIAHATSAVLTGSDARPAICSAARDITDALAALLFEPDLTGRTLTAVHTAGLALPELAVPTDSACLTARTYRTARTQTVADLVADPGTDQAMLTLFRSVPGGDRLRSAVFVPVVHDGHTRAVLVVTLPRPLEADNTRVLGLLELLAADAAIALSREDLLHELAHHSATDPLTGLANRRRWDTDLNREIARATRTGVPLSVITLDLDHFKAYNDTYGHPAGDTLLTETAAAWQRLLRAGDVLARLGGEEFAVLLPDCSSTNAARIADSLLRAVPRGQTTSAGVTQWAGDTAQTLLERADVALYTAKSNGRNRVHTATTPQPARPINTGSSRARLHIAERPA